MRKYLTLLLLLISISSYSFNTDYGFINFNGRITSAYLYRGKTFGGLSFQPEAEFNVNGVELDIWANIGSTDIYFSDFTGEIDVTLRYNNHGFNIGGKYFYVYNTYDVGYLNHKIEIFGGYDFLYYVQNNMLKITWNTYVYGNDFYYDKRAYSSYIEFRYSHSFNCGLTVVSNIGLTPWRSTYADYNNGGLEFVNADISLFYDFKFSNGYISPYGMIMFNPYYIKNNNKCNIETGGINFAVGIDILL